MDDSKSTILFFDKETDEVKKEHLFLCNYAASPFVADDNFTYPTVEHYYHVR